MIGWTGFVLIALGMLLLVVRPADRRAFILFLAGDILWLIKGALAGMPDLVAMNAVFSVFAIITYVKWKQQRN